MSSPHPLSPLCVYCGSSIGLGPRYAEAAGSLGRAMGQRGIDLVYGGGRAGMMGHVADGALGAGGHVVGVITRQLVDMETAHNAIPDLRVVDTMHERKMAMAQHARAFVALPGGVGTLDELFEILAWAQLGLHHKPIGLLNTAGFYDKLLAFIDHMQAEGFLRIRFRERVVIAPSPEELLDVLSTRASTQP